MAQRPEDLTLDAVQLLKSLSISNRVYFAKTSLGQELMSALTPGQRAALFPKYYLEGGGKGISGGLSGGTPGFQPMATAGAGETPEPSGGAGGGGSGAGGGEAETSAPSGPQPSQTYAERAWLKNFREKVEKQTGKKFPLPSTQVGTSGVPASGPSEVGLTGSTKAKDLDGLSKQEAYNVIYKMAVKAGSPDPAITASIAMHEAAWLKSSMVKKANNPFGQTVTAKQIKENIGGAIGSTKGADRQGHAIYPDLETAVKDHVRRWGKRYVPGDIQKSTGSLMEGGYNTANAGWAPGVTKIHGSVKPPVIPTEPSGPIIPVQPDQSPGTMQPKAQPKAEEDRQARQFAYTDAEQKKIKNVNPRAIQLFEKLQTAYGSKIGIESGYRDPEHNARAGGAKKSQHIHGNALDLNTGHLSVEERVKIIKIASAMGFKGIGVYQNNIHIDIGQKRFWGPNYKASSLPSWAKDAIEGHMNGSWTEETIKDIMVAAPSTPIPTETAPTPEGFDNLPESLKQEINSMDLAERNHLFSMMNEYRASGGDPIAGLTESLNVTGGDVKTVVETVTESPPGEIPKSFEGDPIGSLENIKDPKYRDAQRGKTEDEFSLGEGETFNYAESKQGQKELGKFGKVKLTKIVTDKGTEVAVNSAIANDARGLLNEMEQRGYNIKNISSYNPRSKRGKKSRSMHGWAAAIDFNPNQNPFSKWKNYEPGKTDMPENMKYLFMKYGFAQIGSDRMHIERVNPSKRKAYLEHLLSKGIISKDDPYVQGKLKEGVLTEEFMKKIPDPTPKPEAVTPTPTTTAPDAAPPVIPVQPEGQDSRSSITPRAEPTPSAPPVSERSITNYAGVPRSETQATPTQTSTAPTPSQSSSSPAPQAPQASQASQAPQAPQAPQASQASQAPQAPQVTATQTTTAPSGQKTTVTETETSKTTSFGPEPPKMKVGGQGQLRDKDVVSIGDASGTKALVTPGEINSGNIKVDPKTGQFDVTAEQRTNPDHMVQRTNERRDFVENEQQLQNPSQPQNMAAMRGSTVPPVNTNNSSHGEMISRIKGSSENPYKDPSCMRAFLNSRFVQTSDIHGTGRFSLGTKGTNFS